MKVPHSRKPPIMRKHRTIRKDGLQAGKGVGQGHRVPQLPEEGQHSGSPARWARLRWRRDRAHSTDDTACV